MPGREASHRLSASNLRCQAISRQDSKGDRPQVAIDALQRGLTVNLIATARASFATCALDETLSTVVARNRSAGFDFLPVLEPTTGHIVGLIEIAPFMKGNFPDARVDTRMRPLSEENLLGADATILMFVRDADRQKCRLIVSEHEISGLVSLSDLQRLPVRAALFGLVTYPEIVMASVIRQEFNGTEDWLSRLPDGRRRKLQDEIVRARKDDELVDALLFTQFVDKATIIYKSGQFLKEPDVFEQQYKKIQFLRDHLAHANDYAASPDAAVETCRTVRLIDQWNDHFLHLL